MDITFHVMAILCPIAMAILAQRPGTRTARVTIYPVGVISAVLALLSLGRRKAQTWTMSGMKWD
jgi:disulfide bond formation protein DsbB